MFRDDQIADHPNPDLPINLSIADEKISAEDAVKPRASYEAVRLARQRSDGWTAERQRLFLATLADTGCVSVAAKAAEITPRSCYRLRRHPKGAAFAKAWDDALRVARHRKPVAQISPPSNRLIMTMLQRMLPQIFGQTGPGDRSAQAPGARGGA